MVDEVYAWCYNGDVMDGIIIKTTKKYLTLRIPWEALWDKTATEKREEELTEEEALKIFKEGEKGYQEGKTETFHGFIRREYPQYARHFDKKS